MSKTEISVENHSEDDDFSQSQQSEAPPLNWKNPLSIVRSPWGQVWSIAFVSFCLPGMYNALSGMGGSGQVDPTVAANASVALLSVGAATGVLFAGPFIAWIGPQWSVAIGGWTYCLYSGSLLNFNHRQNAAFVIAAGAILGLGANFIWIPEGMIMTTYVKDESRGRAIALFWMIFNFGGAIGSLATLGLNYNSSSGTVNDSTYIAYIVIMIFGWIFGALFICPPSKLNSNYKGERVSKINRNHKEVFSFAKVKDTAIFTAKLILQWRLLTLVPMFFYANIFYSYQQNSVNGMTFNIRTRSLNSALYWIAQMIGGFLIGMVLDIKYFKKGTRMLLGWGILFIIGMVIWGGGLSFQLWKDKRVAAGHIQDIDFQDGGIYIGPMFLYIFYGMYDALWQGFCYWMIGVLAKTPAEGGILVGTYKTLQCVGGAMSFRINALNVAPKSQLAMNWGLTGGTLLIALPCMLTYFREDKKGLEVKESEESKVE